MMADNFTPQILRTAADWWLRLRDPAVDERTTAQWLAWIDEDASHLPAFEQVAGFAEQCGAFDERARARLVAEFVPPRRAPRRWLPLAAAAAVLMLIAGYLGWTLLGSGRVVTRDYASAVGAQRTLVLADGSRVVLGGATRLSVRFSRRRRQVELAAGEAYFEVVHDARWPFEVDAGPLRIEDIGTAFDVRRTGEYVTVAMARGRVRVTENAHTTDLVTGQAATYNPAQRAMRIAAIDPADAASWRDARLEFDDEPLSVVVANINRYRARPLRIADADLKSMTFTGTVRTDAIDDWLRALPRAFPLRISQSSGQTVLSDAHRPSLR